jgi:hypothetical protein
MDDSLVPEWIKKRRQEDEIAEAKRDSIRQQAVEASLLLKQEAPKFWSQLQQSLAIAVDSLHVLRLSGSIAQYSEGIRIDVIFHHLVPIQTYTDIIYDSAREIIRCTTMSGGICQLGLCMTSNNEVAAIADLGGLPMNPEQVSEYIMRPMVDYVSAYK